MRLEESEGLGEEGGAVETAMFIAGATLLMLTAGVAVAFYMVRRQRAVEGGDTTPSMIDEEEPLAAPPPPPPAPAPPAVPPPPAPAPPAVPPPPAPAPPAVPPAAGRTPRTRQGSEEWLAPLLVLAFLVGAGLLAAAIFWRPGDEVKQTVTMPKELSLRHSGELNVNLSGTVAVTPPRPDEVDGGSVVPPAEDDAGSHTADAGPPAPTAACVLPVCIEQTVTELTTAGHPNLKLIAQGLLTLEVIEQEATVECRAMGCL